MAQQYATLGVKYGDTLALIEAAGRASVDATIAELARLKAKADAVIASMGGGSSGVGGHSNETVLALARDANRLRRAITPEMKAATGYANQSNTLHRALEIAANALRLDPSKQGQYDAAQAAIEAHRRMTPMEYWKSIGGDMTTTYPSTARGGIAMRDQIRRVAEAGMPEAIIPLNKLPNIMKRMNIGGAGAMAGSGTRKLELELYAPGVASMVGKALIDLEERGG